MIPVSRTVSGDCAGPVEDRGEHDGAADRDASVNRPQDATGSRLHYEENVDASGTGHALFAAGASGSRHAQSARSSLAVSANKISSPAISRPIMTTLFQSSAVRNSRSRPSFLTTSRKARWLVDAAL